MNRILSLPKSVLNFITGVVKEIKLVEFPTRQDTIKMTGIVIFVSIIFLVTLILLDTGFSSVRNYLTSL